MAPGGVDKFDPVRRACDFTLSFKLSFEAVEHLVIRAFGKSSCTEALQRSSKFKHLAQMGRTYIGNLYSALR
jgi:hypothetical protein